MSKRELITRHRDAILALAAQHGANDVRIFGSVARGEDDESSDIDLLVRRLPGSDPFLIFDLRESLQALLACKVDVIAEQPLMRPQLRAEIARDAEFLMRTDKQRLQDIQAAIEEMRDQPLQDRTRFDSDKLLRFFLLKHVEIIGEAVFKLSSVLKEVHPDVPWKKIERSRHILVHDYFDVDWEILWVIVSQHIEPLSEQIEKILKTLHDD